MQKDVIFSEKGERLIAAIQCEIDHHSAKGMRERIDKMTFERKPRILVLDFSAVVFMDSSGLGLIMGRVECASNLGIEVELRGLSPALSKLVHLCGLDRVKNLSLTK